MELKSSAEPKCDANQPVQCKSRKVCVSDTLNVGRIALRDLCRSPNAKRACRADDFCRDLGFHLLGVGIGVAEIVTKDHAAIRWMMPRLLGVLLDSPAHMTR